MKKSITKALAVFMSLMLVLMSAFPAMAENSSEVEAYLNSTYAKAIDPYGSLKKDNEGRYIIPLSKTSVSLKKDTSSKLYTSSWSFKRRYLCKGDKQQLFRFCKNHSSVI